MSYKQDNTICRCLFLRKDKEIISVLYIDGEMELVIDSGETVLRYNENFWDIWTVQVSYGTAQLNDFCLVSDDDNWNIPEDISKRKCETDKSCWNSENIRKALSLIKTDYLFEVKSKSGQLIFDYKSAFPKKAFVSFVAKSQRLDNCVKKVEVMKTPLGGKGNDLTPLAKHFISKLNEDNERNRI